VIIRPLLAGDAPEAAALIHRTFSAFVAESYRPRGVREFLRRNSPPGLLARLHEGQLVLVAEAEEGGGDQAGSPKGAGAAADSTSLVGVAAVRNGNHVSLLFVEPEQHGRGIGRSLFHEARLRIRAALPDIDGVTLNSSDYALEFYRKLGFEATGAAFYRKGMRMTPMRLEL